VPFPVEANGVDAALRTLLRAAGNGNYGMTGFPGRAGRQPRYAPWVAELVSTRHLLVELAKLGNPSYKKANGFQMTGVESEILTLDEVAAYLKAGKRTVYRLAQKGEIPAFKLGGTWRFRRAELNRWIADSISKKKPGRNELGC
jgi:excisionase family DNA binding protein